MTREPPRVVIVGGGFGGLKAARSLSKSPVRVSMIDRSNHHLFQPLLYQVAMAGLSPAEIAVPIRTVLKDQKNCHVLLGEVTSVDLDAQRVHLEHGRSLRYDYLIVAVGAKTNYFGNDDWARYALGLKTIDDAVEIRRRVLLAFEAAERETDPDAQRALLTFVVIGGGPTGVEIAGSLAELGRHVISDDFRRIREQSLRVILVEAVDRLLPGGFAPELSKSAKEQLEELSVEVRLKTPVRGIDEHGVQLENESLDAATVIWTAGVRAKRLGQTLGVPVDKSGRLVVEQTCALPGYPNVFAIGDCAKFVPEGTDQPLPGVSPVAMQQARYVADRIDKLAQGTAVDSKPFSYFDKGIMATIGRSRAVAQTGKLRLHGFVAWVAWLVVHIWYLIGFRNRLLVLLNWAWSYIFYKRGARLITGERAWERMLKLAATAEGSEGKLDAPRFGVLPMNEAGASSSPASTPAQPQEVDIPESSTPHAAN